MTRLILLGGGAMALAVGAGFWLGGTGQATAEAGLLPYREPVAIARGEVLYSETCAACHGASREGQVADWRRPLADGLMPAPPHDESGHTWHHPDEMLFAITKFGTEALVGGSYKSAMAGFGEQLSDEEILAVLAYIKSTWPAEVIETHDKINTDYEATRN